jgi:hypothetical protein
MKIRRVKSKDYPPSIKIFLSDEEMARIEAGPLRATGGRGKGAWLKVVALEALERAEGKA